MNEELRVRNSLPTFREMEKGVEARRAGHGDPLFTFSPFPRFTYVPLHSSRQVDL
jgi:hypothetical protein